jgi:hypothetical protein
MKTLLPPTKKYICFISLLFALQGAYSHEFTSKELVVIHDKSTRLITEYQEKINTLGTDISDINKTKINIENFIKLFVNRKILVFNDLDPSHQLSNLYEVETYASNLALWYPDGLSVFLDLKSFKAGTIQEHGENVYSLDIVTEKKINGNYINKVVNSNTEILLFRIGFVYTNGKFENFRFVGIRDANAKQNEVDQKTVMEVKSTSFPENEMIKLDQLIKSLLADYTNYLALMGNKDEDASDKELYQQSLTQLFTSAESKLYNDLDPNSAEKYFEVKQYLEFYKNNYPEGINNISLNSDSLTYGNIISKSKDMYYRYVYVNKFFSGKFKGKTFQRIANKLIIQVSIEKMDNTFKNVRIEGIDRVVTGYSEAASESKAQAITSFLPITKLTRKGWSMGVSISAGVGQINDQNLTSMNLTNNYHEWKLKSSFCFGAFVSAMYMFNDFMGLESGISFGKYKSDYSINSFRSSSDSVFMDKETSYDINNYPFNKVLKVNYDSAVSITMLQIPLNFVYTIGKPGKVNFTIKPGISLGFVTNTEYKTTGSYAYAGFYTSNSSYPGYPSWPTDRIIDYLPGFFTREGINSIGKIDAWKKFIFSGNLYLGITIPVGYFTTITLGGNMAFSFSDLSASKGRYADIFGAQDSNPQHHVYDRKPVSLKSYTFSVGINYKF